MSGVADFADCLLLTCARGLEQHVPLDDCAPIGGPASRALHRAAPAAWAAALRFIAALH